jgi:hypothetical protein
MNVMTQVSVKKILDNLMLIKKIIKIKTKARRLVQYEHNLMTNWP